MEIGEWERGERENKGGGGVKYPFEEIPASMPRGAAARLSVCLSHRHSSPLSQQRRRLNLHSPTTAPRTQLMNMYERAPARCVGDADRHDVPSNANRADRQPVSN